MLGRTERQTASSFSRPSDFVFWLSCCQSSCSGQPARNSPSIHLAKRSAVPVPLISAHTDCSNMSPATRAYSLQYFGQGPRHVDRCESVWLARPASASLSGLSADVNMFCAGPRSLPSLWSLPGAFSIPNPAHATSQPLFPPVAELQLPEMPESPSAPSVPFAHPQPSLAPPTTQHRGASPPDFPPLDTFPLGVNLEDWLSGQPVLEQPTARVRNRTVSLVPPMLPPGSSAERVWQTDVLTVSRGPSSVSGESCAYRICALSTASVVCASGTSRRWLASLQGRREAAGRQCSLQNSESHFLG